MVSPPRHLPFQSWNPVTGCTKISPGCDRCYAERISLRLQSIGAPKYERGFSLTLHEGVMDKPFTWKTPRLVFVNSMSDLLHRDVPTDFIHRVFAVMNKAWWHEFMIITKRPGRLAALSPKLPWPRNLMVGATVENAAYGFRIAQLRATGAAIKFVTLSPLVGPPPPMDLQGMDWVSAGGENGKGFRALNPAWVRAAHRQCVEQDVPFYFMGWGGEKREPVEDAPAVTERRRRAVDRVMARRGPGVEQLLLPLELPKAKHQGWQAWEAGGRSVS